MGKKQKEEIVVHEGRKLRVIEVLDEGKSNEECEFEKWSDRKYCLEAVKRNGDALMYVKEQDKEICLEAVKQDGYALMYVKEQDKEICLEAVKRNGDALMYVKEHKTFKELNKK